MSRAPKVFEGKIVHVAQLMGEARGAFTMEGWKSLPKQGWKVELRDVEPLWFDECLEDSEHFRLWITRTFAVDVKKEETGFLCAIHLKGMGSYVTAEPISLENLKKTVQAVCETLKHCLVQ